MAFGAPAFGNGKRYLSALSERVEICEIGIWLFGNGVPLRSRAILGRYAERSPLRRASDGTFSTSTVSRGNRSPSKVAKKKVLFLPLYSLGMTTGPLIDPPKSFMISLGTVALKVFEEAAVQQVGPAFRNRSDVADPTELGRIIDFAHANFGDVVEGREQFRNRRGAARAHRADPVDA